MSKSLKHSNSQMPNTWVIIERTSYGPSNSKPQLHTMSQNDRDTWPHLLSMCKHPYLKGLRSTCHNKAVHLITQTLQANKHTRYYTLTNAGNHNNMSQERTIPYSLIDCTCSQTNCQCQTKLRPDILCVLGAPNHTPTPPATFTHTYNTTH